MKKVVLLSEFFPPSHGGIQESLRFLTERLGQNLVVVTPPVEGDRQFDAKQPYTVIRRSLFSSRHRPGWLWLWPWLLKQKNDIDLVIFGHFSAAVTVGSLLKPLGIRYAVCVHGNDLLTETQRPQRRVLIAKQLRAAEWIGTNSDFTLKQIQQLGVPESRIVKLFPMVETTLTTQPAPATADLTLITVCRLVKRKNVSAVLKAVSHLQTEFPKLHYEIIGGGPERAILELEAKNLGIEDRVTFHGNISDEEKIQLMRQSAVAVMTPLSEGESVEGLGLFYLEASALGLPIVATQGGGVGEAVIDHGTGLLVPQHDQRALDVALSTVLGNADQRRILGEAGRLHVQKEFTASVRLNRFSLLLERHRQPHPPRVSIIIPAYQSADTIANTLDDVVSQTWLNTEIIVVNDGSTDDLDDALQPYQQRIMYLQQSNQGAAAARNTGAAKATGDFLLFLDADERLDHDMITTMVVTLQTHPDSSFAYSNFKFGPKGFRLFEYSPDRLRQRNYIHTSSLMRREAFPGFDPSLIKFQDWDLWLTMSEQGKRGIWIPRELFSVQQRADGISTWLPSFMYRLPLVGQGKGNATIAKYRQAEAIISAKHHLT